MTSLFFRAVEMLLEHSRAFSRKITEYEDTKSQVLWYREVNLDKRCTAL